MTISNITWLGGPIDDPDLISYLSPDLAALLRLKNGFILHSGALHVRGAVRNPHWHSLRNAWAGENSFTTQYEDILPTDIPFAQDLFGNQFLLREERVIKLNAETGEIGEKADSLKTFLAGVEQDIEHYLNLPLSHTLEPGQLLFAYPPFCAKESANGSLLKACPAKEVISIHADLARQIRNIPNGARIRFRTTSGAQPPEKE